jgi:hypothetical protein
MWANATLKTRLTIIGTSIAILGGIFTVINQADLAEGHWFATRLFVREQVKEQRDFLTNQLKPLEQRQISSELVQIGAALDGARDKKFDLDVMLTRGDIQVDVRHQIEKQRQDLQDRIDGLTTRRTQLREERH